MPMRVFNFPLRAYIGRMKKYVSSCLGGLLALNILGLSPAYAKDPLLSLPNETVRVVPESSSHVQLSYAPVVKNTAPAVVNVYTSRTVQTRSNDFFDQMFGMRRAPRERTQNSLGSGVIVRSNGIIVTNAHVVNGADELKVVLHDRREYKAKVIAQDEKIDLAVLKIDAEDERLPYLTIPETSDLEIGDIVLAIGNPYGVGQSVTSGIISALGRTNVTDYSAFIQTDAAVNPGNSGGALVNLNGELVGVNTAIFSRSGGSNGIGFTIPAELVARAVESSISEGRIVRPWMGARTNAVDSALAATLGLDRARGAIISEIYPGGPADKAGLEERDVILKLADTEIFDGNGLRFKLATIKRGDTASATIWRDGKEKTVRLNIDTPKEIPARDETFLEGYNPLDGATVVNMSPALGEEIGVDPYTRGVMVLDVVRRSAAQYNGLRPGDLVVDLNDRKITSARHLETELAKADSTGSWSLSIDRGGRIYDVPIRYLPRN